MRLTQGAPLDSMARRGSGEGGLAQYGTIWHVFRGISRLIQRLYLENVEGF